MGRLVKYLLVLTIVAAVVIAAYAMFFELPAPVEDIVEPVEINVTQ